MTSFDVEKSFLTDHIKISWILAHYYNDTLCKAFDFSKHKPIPQTLQKCKQF